MTGPKALIKLKAKIRNAYRELMTSDRVRSAKVWVVLVALTLTFIFGGHAVGRFGLLIGFLLALAMNSLVYFYSDIRLGRLFPGVRIEGQDAWGLIRQTRELAQAIGVKAPPLMIIESATPIAFSAGLIAPQSRIYLSNELLKRLTNQEIRIVLAYELHRIKTQQTRAATAASALVGMITLTARFIDDILLFRWLSHFIVSIRQRRTMLLKNTGILSGPMTLIVSPFVALIVRISVSRKALIASDRVAGEVTRTGNGTVARTLWKLDSYAKTRPFAVDLADAHLFTVSPLTRYPMWRFASAQPSIEARLKALTGFEPL